MQAFPATSRLRRPEEFSAVFSARKVLRGELFSVHMLNRKTTALGEAAACDGPRLGLIVPKKLLRSAVSRNLTKRLVREAFRLNRETLPATDFVFRLTARPGKTPRKVDRKRLNAEIGRLIRRCSR